MVVLRNGAVPLSILDSQVKEWVKNHRKEHEYASDDCECPTTPDPTKRSRCQRSAREFVSHNSGAAVIFAPAFVILLVIRFTYLLSRYY